MRLLLEIILAAALIALAWDKSFKERVSEAPWIGDKIAPVVKTPAQSPQSQHHRSIVTPAPTTASSWMWDPNRKSPLDPPTRKHAETTPH